jgi:hypothetical protein
VAPYLDKLQSNHPGRSDGPMAEFRQCGTWSGRMAGTGS